MPPKNDTLLGTGASALNSAELRGATAAEMAWRGIDLSREGDWQEGLYWLKLAAGAQRPSDAMPSQFYAYLGYGMARYEGERHQGLRLCRHAVEQEFYQPENYLYLARAYLLLGDRRSANDVVERGLQIDAGDEGLSALKRDLGHRRLPVLRFLSRHNFLNRTLGQVRHQLVTRRRGKGSNLPP